MIFIHWCIVETSDYWSPTINQSIEFTGFCQSSLNIFSYCDIYTKFSVDKGIPFVVTVMSYDMGLFVTVYSVRGLKLLKTEPTTLPQRRIFLGRRWPIFQSDEFEMTLMVVSVSSTAGSKFEPEQKQKGVNYFRGVILPGMVLVPVSTLSHCKRERNIILLLFNFLFGFGMWCNMSLT